MPIFRFLTAFSEVRFCNTDRICPLSRPLPVNPDSFYTRNAIRPATQMLPLVICHNNPYRIIPPADNRRSTVVCAMSEHATTFRAQLTSRARCLLEVGRLPGRALAPDQAPTQAPTLPPEGGLL